MNNDSKRVVLKPAQDVTDLDEWFAWVLQALDVDPAAQWHTEGSMLYADLPTAEVVSVLECVRDRLGDAVIAGTVEVADVDVVGSAGDGSRAA